MEGNQDILGAVGLAGKVAVVIGAASGLAQETVRLFAQAGARLVIGDIDEAGMARTAALVEAAGGRVSCHRVDVTRREDIDALADKAMAEAGQVDVWVNSAGWSFLHPIMDTDPEKAQKSIAINMMGPYWGCAAAGRVMKPRGKGSIVNVSSAGGAIPLPNLSIYGMAKAAVNSLTKTCAAEFGPLGLRVNAVAPGYVETPMSTELFRDEQGNIDPQRRVAVLQQMAANSVLGRVGQCSEIAHAILYLASDASSYVTGQVLAVNGGSSM